MPPGCSRLPRYEHPSQVRSVGCRLPLAHWLGVVRITTCKMQGPRQRCELANLQARVHSCACLPQRPEAEPAHIANARLARTNDCTGRKGSICRRSCPTTARALTSPFASGTCVRRTVSYGINLSSTTPLHDTVQLHVSRIGYDLRAAPGEEHTITSGGAQWASETSGYMYISAMSFRKRFIARPPA
eukprot:7390207-Prymnesium_polylepis.1